MFKDEARIKVWGGRGGDGCVALRREKFVPLGGPAGGDGGRGGHLIFRAAERVGSLLPYVRQKIFRAKNGRPGEGGNRTGRGGEDLILPVPVGTIIHDGKTGALLKDLDHLGDEIVICQGGAGGRGNRSLASSINRCPRKALPGGEAEFRELTLELKLIADIGIIGLPNAGKSTLLARISAARPRIAAYPFTTLTPQLGIVDLGDFETMVLADVPGLIEGASQGVGLGDRFLRHVERTQALLHLVDVSPTANTPPAEAYRVVCQELELFRDTLAKKTQVVVANKVDQPGWEPGFEELKKACGGVELVTVSTLTGHNLSSIIYLLRSLRDSKSSEEPSVELD